jgi:hypothetical protein
LKGITNLAALVDEARRHDDLLEIARSADPRDRNRLTHRHSS